MNWTFGRTACNHCPAPYEEFDSGRLRRDCCSCIVNCTEIVIRAIPKHDALDEKGRQSRNLTSVVQRPFGFPGNSVKHLTQKPRTVLRGTSTIFPTKLFSGAAVHLTCHGVVRFTLNGWHDRVWIVRCRRLSHSSGKPCLHAKKIVMSPIPHEQQAVANATATSRRLCVVCWLFVVGGLLTVFLFGLQSVVCSDPVVLHWCKRHVTIDALVRHVAAVDFDINGFGRRCDKQ